MPSPKVFRVVKIFLKERVKVNHDKVPIYLILGDSEQLGDPDSPVMLVYANQIMVEDHTARIISIQQHEYFSVVIDVNSKSSWIPELFSEYIVETRPCSIHPTIQMHNPPDPPF